MKVMIPYVSLLALAVTPAIASSGATSPTSGSAATMSTQAMTAPMFVQMAAMSDIFEIQSSQAALKNSKNADVQKFAQMMIDHHTKMSAELKAAVQAGSVSVQIPMSLTGEKAKMLADLSGMSGEKFDAMYVKAQVQGHQEALQLVQNYAKSGDNPALKQHAQKGAPIIEQHLQMAQKIMSGGKM